VSTGVLAAAADWLEPVKYFNEPWGINTAYLTVGYKYRLHSGTGRSSLFALWEVPTKPYMLHTENGRTIVFTNGRRQMGLLYHL
jgi:hypothetical protein